MKAAQEPGEVATQGDRANVRSPDISRASLPEIGISRQPASAMKKLAAAGEDAIRAEAKAAVAEGCRPSRIIAPRDGLRQSPAPCFRLHKKPRQSAGKVPPASEDITAAMPISA